MEANLENLATVVTEYRRGRSRGPYPETVWAMVSKLREKHTVEEIAEASGINATHVSRRTSRRRRGVFREVKVVSPQPVAVKTVAVEVRRVDGAELRLRLEVNREELSHLFSEFLR